MQAAARITDNVAHPLPPVLTPGPGSLNVLIGSLPAWRGVPAAVAGALQAAKKVADTAIQVAEAATLAAAGTPGAPAAKAAEETTKATCQAAMSAAISAAAAGADIHACTTPLPIPPHGPGVVINGSPTVLINSLCACRVGDTILEAVGPPNTIVVGMFTVDIGDSGTGAAPGPRAGGGGVTPTIAGMAVISLPNGDIKVGNSLIIHGDLNFQFKTIAALGQIAATPTGGALLKSIDGRGKTVTIAATSGGNATGYTNPAARFKNANGTSGAGTDAQVSYNPDLTSIGSQAWETRPPAVGLGHELVHAEQATHGDQLSGNDANDSKPDALDPTQTATEKQRELQAAGIPPYDTYPYNENKMRSEWNPPQPQRQWY